MIFFKLWRAKEKNLLRISIQLKPIAIWTLPSLGARNTRSTAAIEVSSYIFLVRQEAYSI
jgi:hypothetical protein